jgi:hypothetical protein
VATDTGSATAMNRALAKGATPALARRRPLLARCWHLSRVTSPRSTLSPWLLALAQNLCLESVVMPPPGDFVGVHFNFFGDTIVAAYPGKFKKGLAGCLQRKRRRSISSGVEHASGYASESDPV